MSPASSLVGLLQRAGLGSGLRSLATLSPRNKRPAYFLLGESPGVPGRLDFSNLRLGEADLYRAYFTGEDPELATPREDALSLLYLCDEAKPSALFSPVREGYITGVDARFGATPPGEVGAKPRAPGPLAGRIDSCLYYVSGVGSRFTGANPRALELVGPRTERMSGVFSCAEGGEKPRVPLDED